LREEKGLPADEDNADQDLPVLYGDQGESGMGGFGGGAGGFGGFGGGGGGMDLGGELDGELGGAGGEEGAMLAGAEGGQSMPPEAGPQQPGA